MTTNERKTPQSLGLSPVLTSRPDPEAVISIRYAEMLRVAKQNQVSREAGDILKDVGETHPACYAIMSGEVEIRRDIQADDGTHTVVLQRRQKGDMLNEIALFSGNFLNLTTNLRYVAMTDVKLGILTPELLREKMGVHFSLFVQFMKGVSIKGATAFEAMSELYKTQYNYRVTDKDLQITALLARATTLEQQMPPLEASNEQLMEENVEFRSQVDQLQAEAKRLKDEIDKLKAANAKLKQERMATANIAFTSLQEDERRSKAIVVISNFFMKLVGRELTVAETDEARRLLADLHPQWTHETQVTLETSLQDELRKALVAELDGPPTPADAPIEKVVENPQRAVTVREGHRDRLQSPPVSTVREGTHVPLQRTPSRTMLAAVQSPDPLRLPSPTFAVKPGSKGMVRNPTNIGMAPASQMPPTKPEGRRQTPLNLALPALPPRPTVERSPHTVRGTEAPKPKSSVSGEQGVPDAFKPKATPTDVKALRAQQYPLAEDTEKIPQTRKTLDWETIQAMQAKAAEEAAAAQPSPTPIPENFPDRPPVSRREVTQRNKWNVQDIEADLGPPPTKE